MSYHCENGVYGRAYYYTLTVWDIWLHCRKPLYFSIFKLNTYVSEYCKNAPNFPYFIILNWRNITRIAFLRKQASVAVVSLLIQLYKYNADLVIYILNEWASTKENKYDSFYHTQNFFLKKEEKNIHKKMEQARFPPKVIWYYNTR